MKEKYDLLGSETLTPDAVSEDIQQVKNQLGDSLTTLGNLQTRIQEKKASMEMLSEKMGKAYRLAQSNPQNVELKDTLSKMFADFEELRDDVTNLAHNESLFVASFDTLAAELDDFEEEYKNTLNERPQN